MRASGLNIDDLRAYAAVGLAAAVLAAIGRERVALAAPPQMVRWEILATVTEVVDPLGLFPDVRVGDPVRGMLKYDLTLLPNPLFSSTYDHVFTNDLWIDVSRMIIDNPRNGTEFRFKTDVNEGIMYVDVFNDFSVDDVTFDGIYAPQPVVPPPGYMGTSPVVAVVLEGPPTVFPDPPVFPTINSAPPAELELDDWPAAAMVFWDTDFEDPTATSIEAEIHSLTPVIEPHLTGDFDYDGDVDDDDYVGWMITYGEYGDDYQHYADADGDDDVDGADLLAWQRQSGSRPMTASANAAVPEPTTSLLVIVAAVGIRLMGGQMRQKLVNA